MVLRADFNNHTRRSYLDNRFGTVIYRPHVFKDNYVGSIRATLQYWMVLFIYYGEASLSAHVCCLRVPSRCARRFDPFTASSLNRASMFHGETLVNVSTLSRLSFDIRTFASVCFDIGDGLTDVQLMLSSLTRLRMSLDSQRKVVALRSTCVNISFANLLLHCVVKVCFLCY